MALIDIATTTVTSAVASVTLTGIDSNSVYMLSVNDAIPASDTQVLRVRVTESGTANSTTNYDNAFRQLKANTSFSNGQSSDQTGWLLFSTSGTGSFESSNGLMYLYNMNDSSEFSYASVNDVTRANNGKMQGNQGGGAFTSASQCDGVNISYPSGNIANGKFTLYKVV